MDINTTNCNNEKNDGEKQQLITTQWWHQQLEPHMQEQQDQNTEVNGKAVLQAGFNRHELLREPSPS